MMSARTLRIMRWAQFAGLTLGAFSLACGLLTGEPGAALAAAVLIVFWLALICGQTWLIRHRVELERPRPDYAAIARMEREVYGEAFRHEGAPSQSGRSNPDLGQCDYCDRHVYTGGLCLQHARKQKQSRVPFEDDRRAMRALAAARRQTHPCPGCGFQFQGILASASYCQYCGWKFPAEAKHRSNLRWERPS